MSCGYPLAYVGAANPPSVLGGGGANPLLQWGIPYGPGFPPGYPGGGMPLGPGGNCVPGGNYYAPGCSPCPPSAESVAAQQAAYNAACAAKAASFAQAARTVVASQQPQIGLGIRTAGAVTVAAGASATLTATASVPICITDFEVSRSIAEFFLINSLKVSRVDYLADGQGLPADAFAPDAEHPPLEMPMLWPGTTLNLIVENIDAAEHRFFGMFWGIAGPAAGPCLG